MSQFHHAFGDESCGTTHVTYAVLSMPEGRQAQVEGQIAETKRSKGGTEADRLHCREIFHPGARQKTAWAALDNDDVFALYGAIADSIAAGPVRRIVAIANKADFPKDFLVGPLQSSGGLPPIPGMKNYLMRDKEFAAQCAQGALLPLSKNPGFRNVRFWADHDKTKIEWIVGAHQASRAASLFVSVGKDGEADRVNLMTGEGDKPPLLEVADLIAYVAQRAASRGSSPNDRRFADLHSKIAPEVIHLGLSPDGGLGFNVPDSSMR
ncbi:hypothetical protein C7I87_32275 [Mesorhizobium sp. SARCC-RB16n]|uniref:hypothetical protein n=1 Tax=Mesorhizobium sp. SARCC-RB16n TaxID=2116687 RepID=UPI00122F1F56|nr:hypothetical protein [Mesorhizobium sp. SARCC-RB16n]KAA3442116.1 hypothetical protein C7I87_32275 [Mesorhizobium sp. SARCC-RB16n]